MATGRLGQNAVSAFARSKSKTGGTVGIVISGWASQPVLLAGVCILLLCGALFSLFIDAPVSTAMREAELPGDITKFISLSEVFAHGLGVATILLALLLGAPERMASLLFVVLLTAGSGLAANGLKACFVRVRPHAQHELVLGGSREAIVLQSSGILLAGIEPENGMRAHFGKGRASEAIAVSFWDARQRSFPSGHAAIAWGLALGLSLVFPRVTWLFGMLAIMACVQRLTSGAHFLSDVLAGAAIAFGCGAALLLMPLCQRMLKQNVEVGL